MDNYPQINVRVSFLREGDFSRYFLLHRNLDRAQYTSKSKKLDHCTSYLCRFVFLLFNIGQWGKLMICSPTDIKDLLSHKDQPFFDENWVEKERMVRKVQLQA